MNTNRSGTKTLSVPKARSLMHEVFKIAYRLGRAEADKPLKSEGAALAQRLEVIKQELGK